MTGKNFKVVVRMAESCDLKKLDDFYKLTLTDTFEKNGLGELEEEIAQEIDDKKKRAREFLEHSEKTKCLLVAVFDEEIAGAIAYCTSNELLVKCTVGQARDIIEIGNVMVHPKHQNRGVLSLLMRGIIKELVRNNVLIVALDCGYKLAQNVWCHKLGEPTHVLIDYWGKGEHHMAWVIKTAELANSFPEKASQ